MKILNSLSFKDLKLNKKRSLVIIIGIILSTALICGVAGIASSFQHTFIEYEKQNDGDYHAMFYDVPSSELKYIEENRNVEKYYLSENLGYAKLENCQNENKPYLNVMSMNDDYIKNMGIKLTEGRMPENSDEIVISKHILTNAKVNFNVGDTISLDIGERELENGTILNQNNPYGSAEETDDYGESKGEKLNEQLVNTTKKTFKIVGIVERPSNSVEPYTAPGYTVITKMEKPKSKANIAVTYKNVFKYQEYTEQINDMIKGTENDKQEDLKEFAALKNAKYKSYKYDVKMHKDLLSYEGANLSDESMKMLYTLVAIIVVIILISSVFVIRNGFAISITERLKQYGMLSSIGATKRQIKKSVYFEGLILGLIGIPLGILSGILAIDVLLNLVNYILKEYINNTELIYNISWIAIVASVVIAVITIWLSCKSSARKASKITPIEAIRSSDDVKLKAKKVKCPKIITKVFKTGGEIAYKNLKRSRRKYRTTVISIIVSVVTFITISSFIQFGFKMSDSYITEIGYNISVCYSDTDSTDNLAYQRLEEISKLEGIKEYSIPRYNCIELENNEHTSDFGKAVKQTMKNQANINSNINEDHKDSIQIISLGKEQYQKFVKKINGNYENYKNGGILIDSCISYIQEENNGKSTTKKTQGNLYNFQKGDTVTGKIYKKLDNKNEEKPTKDQQIKIVAKTEERPMGFENLYTPEAYLIVSDEYIENIGFIGIDNLRIKADDSYKVEEEINQYIKSKNISEETIQVYNQDEQIKAMNAIVLVISIFLYGFIAVITAIGITNIFNTITTNMNLRKKEFAMLKSIGMTKKEFNRMIRLESIFYGVKSLIIGIPIGIGLSYLVYKAFENGMNMGYQLPVKAILIAIVFVALVISIIMKYSMSKINKQNIIETIRNDNI